MAYTKISFFILLFLHLLLSCQIAVSLSIHAFAYNKKSLWHRMLYRLPKTFLYLLWFMCCNNIVMILSCACHGYFEELVVIVLFYHNVLCFQLDDRLCRRTCNLIEMIVLNHDSIKITTSEKNNSRSTIEYIILYG